METFLLVLLGIYGMGFAVVFTFHLVFLQMVTVPLAFLRAIVWPIYMVTGWPQGGPI